VNAGAAHKAAPQPALRRCVLLRVMCSAGTILKPRRIERHDRRITDHKRDRTPASAGHY
jgi:hypothetical protein